MLNIGLEQQQQIRGGDGTLLWSGGQAVAASYIAINNSATAALMGEAVLWDPQTVALGFIPRQETTAAGVNPTADLPGSLVIGVKRIPSAALGVAVGFLGVSQEPIGSTKRGLVAGIGSLTTAICTAGAIPVGDLLVSAATTVGAVAAAAVKSATLPIYGSVLGQCFKTNTTGATGTGSTGFVGLLVNPT